MAHSDENKPKNTGERMIERFLRGVPEEARLPDNDTPDLNEGTSREIAFITDDGSLCINYFGQKDYVSGRGWNQFSPDDPQYGEYCAKYGVNKPGDHKCIFSKFIDGEWVVVDDEHDSADPKPVTGTSE